MKINDYCKIPNYEMFQSFEKQNTITSADQRDREREREKETRGRGWGRGMSEGKNPRTNQSVIFGV